MFWVGVVPRGAGKGRALEFVLGKLGGKPSQTMVAGDSGNDISMFDVDSVFGTVVANAQDELREYHQRRLTRHLVEDDDSDGTNKPRIHISTRKYADAIVDGLEHFNFTYSLSSR